MAEVWAISYPIAAKTRSSGQCDITDVRWAWARYRFIDDQCSIFHFCPSRLFHLPKFLQIFDHINYKLKRINTDEFKVIDELMGLNTKRRILFSPIFSTNFSQFEYLVEKENKLLIGPKQFFFSVCQLKKNSKINIRYKNS